MHVVCQHGRMHRRRRCRFVVLAGRRCSPITVTRSCRTIIAASFGSLVADNHERLAIQATGLVTCTWTRSPPAECLRSASSLDRLSCSRPKLQSALFFGGEAKDRHPPPSIAISRSRKPQTATASLSSSTADAADAAVADRGC